MKKVFYQNALGQKIFFDNKTLFCESIDMLGNSAVHASETLALSDGQVTLSHQLAPKTIPCSFAFKNRNPYDKQILESIFNPLISGTLTVYTDSNVYQIDCYPQNVPTFKRDAVPYVYRFDVDFVADFPYWRVGQQQFIPITGSVTSYFSNCTLDLPVEIRMSPANWDSLVIINGNPIFLSPHEEQSLIINTLNFTIKDTQGNNCLNLLDSDYPVDKLVIRYRTNQIYVQNHSHFDGVQISFYNLSFGEM